MSADGKLFVFAGPTVSHEEIRRAAPFATVLPPVARGDVLRLVLNREPAAIAIIDGYFDTVPAVTHKEILFALSRGVRVLGASSMGALRAAELWRFGMEGVGVIFAHFRDGLWEADDEVAVTHGPAESGYRAGSVALANIRLGLRQATAAGITTSEVETQLVAAAKAMFYADRSWHRLFAMAADVIPAGELDALRAFVAAERPDAKRDDAMELLVRLREPGVSPGAPITFDFEPTVFWERLVAETQAVASVADSLRLVDVVHPEMERHVRLSRDGPDILRGALLMHVLMAQERARPEPITEGEIQAATRRFRRRRGLLAAADLKRWCHAQDLTDPEFELLMRLEVQLDTMLRDGAGAVRGLLPLELKRRGVLDAVAEQVAKKKVLRERSGAAGPTLDDVGLSLAELMEWYQSSFESVEGSLDAYAGSLGFTSVRQFLSEVMLEYRLRHPDGHTPRVVP